MRNINGGVYGRLLAQAWSSTQSGRGFSSSIRRSREERKAMIESFVKEYEKSNNGRFPSISLTQKEVGGRFHIVRRILQELKDTWTQNQGLQAGPDDEFPLGAISEKPRPSASLSSKGTVAVSDEHSRLDGEGEHHRPISNRTSAASKQEVIENPIYDDLVDVENVDSNETEVVAGVLSGGSSEVEQLGVVVVEGHPIGGETDTRSDANTNGGVYDQAVAQAWSSSQSGRGCSSSIRRSREERKAMVESFIKEYTRSNSGRFPPINLTLKEVGGHFYVVRHIFQELKVTWTPNQGSQTGPTDEVPRGAISRKPQSSASLSRNGTVPVPDEHPRLDGEGEHHPSNGTSAASRQEVIENPIDDTLMNVQNVDYNVAKVVAGTLSGGSSEVEQLSTVVEGHPIGGKIFDTRTDTEIQGGGGSQEKGGVYCQAPAEAWPSSQSGQEFPSSIRASREERKAMIESFVIEYKETNNGSFPPINLIQKEVGGGFHVVRHILQELKATWRENQGSQTGPADEQLPRGKISKKPGSSASSMKRTVPVSDELSRLDGEGEHQPISNRISGASNQKVVENPFDDDLINVENVDSNGAKVVAGVQSGGSSKVEQLSVVVDSHPIGGKTFDIRNDTEIQGGGRSLEKLKHAKELPKVVASTPSLEIQDFAEPVPAGGSMKIERVVERRVLEGSVAPKENISIETSDSQPITAPTDDREEKVELDARNKGSGSDKDGSLEQSCIESNKVVNDTRESLDVPSTRQPIHQQQTGISDNVQHRRDMSMEERRVEVVPVQKAKKTIGASLKSFVVDAFRKFWSG